MGFQGREDDGGSDEFSLTPQIRSFASGVGAETGEGACCNDFRSRAALAVVVGEGARCLAHGCDEALQSAARDAHGTLGIDCGEASEGENSGGGKLHLDFTAVVYWSREKALQ